MLPSLHNDGKAGLKIWNEDVIEVEAEVEATD